MIFVLFSLFLFFSSYSSNHESISIDNSHNLTTIIKEHWEKNNAEYYANNQIHFYLKENDLVESFPVNDSLCNFFISLSKNKRPFTSIVQYPQFNNISALLSAELLDELFEIAFSNSNSTYTIKYFLYKVISSRDTTICQTTYQTFLQDLEQQISLQYNIKLRDYKNILLYGEVVAVGLYGSVFGFLSSIASPSAPPNLTFLISGLTVPAVYGLAIGSSYLQKYFEFKKCLNLINQAKSQQINNAEAIQ